MIQSELLQEEKMYAEVLLPLALPRTYTYLVPELMQRSIAIGKRVEVQFGSRRIYSGIVKNIHRNAPQITKVKELLSVIDEQPIIQTQQFQFWKWIADYYCCYEGEVMNAALPSGFKLESESKICFNYSFGTDFSSLDDDEYIVAEALTVKSELDINEIQKLLNKKSVRKILNSLLAKNVIRLKEEMIQKYKPRTEIFIQMHEAFTSDAQLSGLFEELKRAPAQEKLLLAYLHLVRTGDKHQLIKRAALLKKSDAKESALKGLIAKGIFVQKQVEVDRITDKENKNDSFLELSEQQTSAIEKIKNDLKEKDVTLLHGITGSGKTALYIKLAEEIISEGKQVLFLVPEIALTSQLVNRLRKFFGEKLGVYHSRFNPQERVEIWNKLLKSRYNIIIGARSALFLPFNNLGLVIVDEEHDSSYKQFDPAPRYHARDAAIYLSQLHGAKTILGSATPSLESYFNAQTEKYSLVELKEQFSQQSLSEIIPVNTKKETRERKMQSHFSSVLMSEIKKALDQEEQIILFQNRRGYSSYLECRTCEWVPQCPNCDVHLTYHKQKNELCCHYCGFKRNPVTKCEACGSTAIQVVGFGTEKIEDELKTFFPEVKAGRMDADNIRTRSGHDKIISDFEEKKLQVLVGTQMVAKGLDFDHVSLVGVMNADQLLMFPDFRSAERAYQMIEQVSGRAGRKNYAGKVIVQTERPEHYVLQFVQQRDYKGFYNHELLQRQGFCYPPYTRLIKLSFKHKEQHKAQAAAIDMAKALAPVLQHRLLGPAEPYINRIKNQYIIELLCKLEKNQALIKSAKETIMQERDYILAVKGNHALQIEVNVDPF